VFFSFAIVGYSKLLLMCYRFHSVPCSRELRVPKSIFFNS